MPNQLREGVSPRILKLTLKKKWFDMILSGEKKEEYREIKDYWIRRLCINGREYESKKLRGDKSSRYKFIRFTHGYAKNAPSFLIECNGIEIGEAKPEWSDNWQGEVFILKLGKIINPSHLHE